MRCHWRDICQDVGDSMEQKKQMIQWKNLLLPNRRWNESSSNASQNAITETSNDRNKHVRALVGSVARCIHVFTVWVVTGWVVQS